MKRLRIFFQLQRNTKIKKIIVYSNPTCSDCRHLKRWLDERGITYEEKDIEADPEACRAMLALTQDKKVTPTLAIEGKTLIHPPFPRLAEELGLHPS